MVALNQVQATRIIARPDHPVTAAVRDTEEEGKGRAVFEKLFEDAHKVSVTTHRDCTPH